MPGCCSPKCPFKNRVIKIKTCPLCELQLAANSSVLSYCGLTAFCKRSAWNRSNLKQKTNLFFAKSKAVSVFRPNSNWRNYILAPSLLVFFLLADGFFSLCKGCVSVLVQGTIPGEVIQLCMPFKYFRTLWGSYHNVNVKIFFSSLFIKNNDYRNLGFQNNNFIEKWVAKISQCLL